TYANYSRIENGMTREQVEALLGPPNSAADLYVGLRTERLLPADVEDPNPNWLFWRTEDGARVEVLFDENARADTAMWNAWPDERNSLEKLRDRLPWIARNPPPNLPRIIK